jgi:sugar-specific transcriptional regulator TrmB
LINHDEIIPNEIKKNPIHYTMIKKLKDLGLTKNESKIYIYLSETGPKRMTVLANETKIPRTETYLLLKFLKLKGAVKQSLERPIKVSALPIGNVIESIIKLHQKRIEELNSKKNEIIEEWNLIQARSKLSDSKSSKIESLSEKYGRSNEFREEFKRSLKKYRKKTEEELNKNQDSQ